MYVRERCHDGRNLLLRGQAQRLTKELVQLAPVGTDVVIANTVRSDSANHTASGTGSNSAALSVDETVKRKYCVLRVDRRCPLRGIHTVGIPV